MFLVFRNMRSLELWTYPNKKVLKPSSLWGLSQRQGSSHGSQFTRGKREASLPMKRWGKELVAVTEEVWTEQLQALKNMTKANLHQSMKCMETFFWVRHSPMSPICYSWQHWLFSHGSKVGEGSCYQIVCLGRDAKYEGTEINASVSALNFIFWLMFWSDSSPAWHFLFTSSWAILSAIYSKAI